MISFVGKGVIEGIAIGTIQMLNENFDKKIKAYKMDSIEEEQEKYQQALLTARKQLETIIDKAKGLGNSEQVAVMEAHLLMVGDPALEGAINQYINEMISAPKAVQKASQEMADMLESLEDPYLKERSSDVRDVGKRLLRLMLGMIEPKIEGESIILCGDDIDPSVMANISPKQVKGIILGSGSTTSHTVIIAKAKGLVTVVGFGDIISQIQNQSKIIIDGYEGTLFIQPNCEILNQYQIKVEEENKLKAYYMSLCDLPGRTIDGYEMTLAANIGNPRDIDDSLIYGCQGVGLFRTEFVFMGKHQMPTEEEQFKAYKYVVERLKNELCVIRTMDIGGDKSLDYLSIGEEDNPFLGWRAIRICLEKTEIFLTQIKAILRAGIYGEVAIMLPMIVNLTEIKAAKALIAQAMTELDKANIAYSRNVEIGIMIETPAAAVMASAFAKEVDFFSIGTNDLVQYCLAVDRGNQKVSYLYDHFNPAVIRLIAQVIQEAHKHGLWVGMCGEMAGDPLATPLLLAMGIDELSMSGPSIPKVKDALRKLKVDKDILEKVLELNDVEDIRQYLKNC